MCLRTTVMRKVDMPYLSICAIEILRFIVEYLRVENNWESYNSNSDEF